MNCVECEEVISNPICPECLSEGIACWVGERLGPLAANAVFDITDALVYPGGSTSCIKCNKSMALCAYCYTNAVMSILKNHPVVLTQFVDYFGFEFEKLQRVEPSFGEVGARG